MPLQYRVCYQPVSVGFTLLPLSAYSHVVTMQEACILPTVMH